MLNNVHFLHPEWLWLLVVIPAVWGMKVWRSRRMGGWEQVVDKHLMPFVLTGKAGGLSVLSLVLLSLALLTAVLAMAGPAWEKREVPVFRNQQALVVAMDFSASMYAEDEKPNRITLARFKLLDILKARQDAQNGLVVFAGDAFTVTPLTDDSDTIEEQVKNLSPEIMPAPGSLLTPAIQRSVELLQQSGMKQGNILLITDGVADVESSVTAAEAARNLGYSVSVLSLGTAEGAAVPRAQGGFLLDNDGKTVIAPVNLEELERIATAGGGVFTQAALGDADLNALSAQWQALANSALSTAQGRKTDTWVNEGYWLVLLLLPVAMLAFRRGWLGVLLVCILLPQQQPAHAFGWDELWQTPDQQAQSALDNGRPDIAAQLFEDTTRKGVAAYQSGDYAKAEQLLKNDVSATGRYNYGNALAKQGKFEEAITAYQEALKQQPDMDDAKTNLGLAEFALVEKPKKEPDPNGDEDGTKPDPNGDEKGQTEKPDPNGDEDGTKPDPNGNEKGQTEKPDPNGKKQGEELTPDSNGKEIEEIKSAAKDDKNGDLVKREQEQATEQWLRRIPDDPSGLWRRKFQYQYQQRGAQTRGEEW